eukprot:CAMPEP_0179141408 /NCGR_PEP_ID=MMETSP0796-20121207/67816_1 /TAXON_ID=73915 /ORGANISM="Pyrodinium bahamense, Strain pbaha01" /LENGTH=78 /DNA_ID=CAMNT_0020841121 /DNA_START=3 /DNA_END=236 /DNA_ORIENTATION=+
MTCRWNCHATATGSGRRRSYESADAPSAHSPRKWAGASADPLLPPSPRAPGVCGPRSSGRLTSVGRPDLATGAGAEWG